MVRTNIQTFSGEVEILSNLHVGSNLVANDTASNVLSVTGAIGANIFIGDGGLLSNIATTLGKIVDQGNVVANVVQFSSNTGYGGVGIVTDSNVGIQNTSPLHTLSIGDKVYFDTDSGSSEPKPTINVEGRIIASRFEGDGGLLSNIATTLQSIVDQGNVSANVMFIQSAAQFDSEGVGLVTTSNVGIQNTSPSHHLSVGSNLFVSDVGSNVLTVLGNVAVSNLNLGEFTITPSYGFNDVTNTSNGTTNVVLFQNTTTSLVADSNIVAAGNVTALQLISTANTEVGDRLKFSESNVYIDTLRVADVASNLVTYDRATGELTDSGGTFSNKFAVVSKQPPSVLSANATTVTNHGTYTLTTSNLATNSNTFNAFDGTATGWVSSENYNGGGGTVFHENNLTQLSNLHPTQFGDWLAVEFPYKTTLRHMKLTPLTAAQYPTSANLYATNNDLTWSEIKYWKDVDPVTDSNVQTIVVNATEQFKKYALVATKAKSAANVAIQDWQLFTESFSIDGGKVAMAQQAATGGETVMDQSGPHSRLPKVVPLKKYPEIAFEEGKFDKNGTTNVYVQAGYIVESSSQFNTSETYAPWKAFNGVIETTNNASGEWLSGQDTYSGTVNSGAYDATRTIFESTPGEWIGIRMPKKIKLSKASVSSRWDTGDPRSVREYKLWASNNASDWYELATGTSTLSVTSSPNTFDINVSTTDYYSMFRLQILSMNANNGEVGVGEFQLYGYEEDPPAGDISVDTTFTSIMNTPQTTGANVYVDGNLGETFTNRVTGPTISNTHTTYVSAGKYWELSGNVESNVTIEANTFLSGDAPHSVSVWFNSSNLEANASNSCIFSLGTEERLDHNGVAFSNNYQTVLRLLPSDIAAGDLVGGLEHGVAMSSDGTKVIVGAYKEHANGTSEAGAAYIYTYSNGSWIETKLVSPDIVAAAQFGVSVDMNSDGTKVIVGAFEEDINGDIEVGAAYIFTYSNGSWDTGTKIVASDKNAVDRFGYSVAMSGDGNRVIVGAYLEDEDANGQNTLSTAGSAYIFTYSNGSWDTGTKIVASNRSAGAIFGRSVAINNDGTMVIVGASAGDSSTGTTTATGSAYIFTYSNGSWSETKLLEASDGATSDQFGFRVDMSSDGTKVIVGAYDHHTDGLADAGAAYIFTYSNGSWDTGTKIVAPDKEAGDEFGVSVGMNPDGTKVVVGAWNDDPGGVTGAGAAYIYNYDGSSWDTGIKIVAAPDGIDSDLFGRSVAINSDGSKVIVGAYSADVAGTNSGAAYIFTRDTTHHLTTDLKLQSNTWHNLTYAYQGEGGSRVTYLDGRKVAEDQAEDTFGEYPPIEIDTFSLGGYVVDASYWNSGGSSPYYRFAYNLFHSLSNEGRVGGFYTDSNGNYVPDPSDSNNDLNLMTLTDTSGTAHFGHWVSLELPYKLSPSHCEFEHYGSSYRLKDFVILGSNHGPGDVKTGFTLLFSGQAHVDNNGTNKTIHTFTGSGKFKYLIFLTKSLNTGNSTWIINRLRYYGHRENDLVRLPDPTNVLKYPHITMTGPAQRGYVASASDENSAYPAWEAFDDKYTDLDTVATSPHALNRWQPTGGYTDSGTTWNADGTETTTLASGSSPPEYDGEWLQLESPNKVNVTSYRVYNSTDYVTDYNAHTVVMLGSNTGVDDWVDIGSGETVLSWSPNTSTPDGSHTLTLAIVNTSGNTGFYKYHRLVVTKVVGQNLPVIFQLQLFGTEEASQVPIQIGGGNIDKVANFRVYDKFIDEDQALEIWDAQKDEFGRAKSSMTLHKGRLGIGTTEPEGRLAVLDEPNGLEVFPPGNMVADETYFEGHGIFKARGIVINNTVDYPPWEGFNDFASSQTLYYTGSSGGATGDGGFNNSDATYSGTLQLSSETVLGPWLILELPYKVYVSKIEYYPQLSGVGGESVTHQVAEATIYGRNGNGIWKEIATMSTAPIIPNHLHHTFNTLDSSIAYNQLAFIATKRAVQSTSGITVRNLKFFGTREQGQSVLHDGQLTLTKNLNVPRIGPALNVDNTPRRDRLISEFNTSTNPTFKGAVRDTSGRGNDGMLVADASYNAVDKALVFDGTGDYIKMTNWNYGTGFVHSFSGWVKFKSPEESWTVLYGVGNASGTGATNFTIWALTQSLYFRTEADGGGGYIDHTFEFSTYMDRWIHIAVVKPTAAINSTRMYVNGELLPQTGGTNASNNVALPNSPQRFNLGATAHGTGGGSEINADYSNIKFYDCALTTEEIKALYDMGRCDEGHHVVNFSKTRVGIGLGDGEAPLAMLDSRDTRLAFKYGGTTLDNFEEFTQASAWTKAGSGTVAYYTNGSIHYQRVGNFCTATFDYSSFGVNGNAYFLATPPERFRPNNPNSDSGPMWYGRATSNGNFETLWYYDSANNATNGKKWIITASMNGSNFSGGNGTTFQQWKTTISYDI